MIRKNDLLQNVQVAKPCPADWSQMEGDDRVRHCTHCKLNVFNLSGMSADEAETLLRNREGRLCVRYYRRADGTVITKDCPKGIHAIRKRMAWAFAAAAAAIVSLTGCGCAKEEPPGGTKPANGGTTPQKVNLNSPPVMGGVPAQPTMGIVAPSEIVGAASLK